ncbi:MAG: hypothetical protein P4L40_14845 [Terracidiphilus sp.]|nr:hypothetical protein [Terracidiphilus sp.]
MNLLLRALSVVAVTAMLVSKCGSAPGAAKAPQVDVIVTAAPIYRPLGALHGEERFPQGAQLLLIRQGKSEPLVKGFAASADANVSFDGKSVLFSGKQAAGDPWQIWELTLADGSVRRLITSATDAIRPLYLPAGQFVYALRTSAGYQLEVAGKSSLSMLAPIAPDAGSTVLPISYLPSSAIPVDVLQDGRILFEANYPLGAGSTPELYLVYSDGSGVESYRCDHGRARWGGRQLASGDVVFTHGSSLARFTSPLAHEAPVAAPRAEYAGAVAETAQGDWLFSARTQPSAHFALKLLKPKPGTAAIETVLALSGQDLVEPVLVAPRTRPHHHPSALHRWSYANLLALDSRLSREGDLKTVPTSIRLETLDAEGRVVANGAAPVEADGSFFVQTPADRPIRFALLNAKGAVVRQEHGWFWIRSGEQRICTGCHTGPERASENRVPAVLLRTTVPADLTGIKAIAQSQTTAPGGK